MIEVDAKHPYWGPVKIFFGNPGDYTGYGCGFDGPACNFSIEAPGEPNPVHQGTVPIEATPADWNLWCEVFWVDHGVRRMFEEALAARRLKLGDDPSRIVQVAE